MDDDGWKSVKPFLQQHKINYPIVIGNSEMGDRSSALGKSDPLSLS